MWNVLWESFSPTSEVETYFVAFHGVSRWIGKWHDLVCLTYPPVEDRNYCRIYLGARNFEHVTQSDSTELTAHRSRVRQVKSKRRKKECNKNEE